MEKRLLANKADDNDVGADNKPMVTKKEVDQALEAMRQDAISEFPIIAESLVDVTIKYYVHKKGLHGAGNAYEGILMECFDRCGLDYFNFLIKKKVAVNTSDFKLIMIYFNLFLSQTRVGNENLARKRLEASKATWKISQKQRALLEKGAGINFDVEIGLNSESNLEETVEPAPAAMEGSSSAVVSAPSFELKTDDQEAGLQIRDLINLYLERPGAIEILNGLGYGRWQADP